MSRVKCTRCGRKRDEKFMEIVPLDFVRGVFCSTPTSKYDRLLNQPSCYQLQVRELSVQYDLQAQQLKNHLDTL